MPAGLLQDEAHNFVLEAIVGSFEVSGNATVHVTTTTTSTSLASTTSTVQSSVVKLVLLDREPPHEIVPAFSLPTSAPVLLTFSDQIQAGSGSVTFVPRFSSPIVSISAEEVILAEDKVFISPPQGLVAGEVYSIRIDQSAFRDSHFNYFDGIQDSYTISIAQSVLFQDFASGQDVQSFGARFSSSIVVDQGSNIFIVGGRNATETINPDPNVTFDATLSDVWKLSTGSTSSCASAFDARGSCSAATCSAPANGSDLPNLGHTVIQRKVWRSASEGGSNCMNGDVRMNAINDVVDQSIEECPCPMCIVQPSNPLPLNMSGSDYVAAYKHVSAFMGERNVSCADGYVATGDFVCTVQDIWTATYQRPYPQCVPAPCSAPPDLPSGSRAVEILNATCLNVSSTNPLEHGALCSFKCESGYHMAQPIQCSFGKFIGPTCAPLPCAVPEVTSGGLFCPNSTDDSIPETGGTCQVACDAGYTPQDTTASVACIVNSSGGLESMPITQSSGTLACAPSVCDVFSYLSHEWGTTFNPEIKEPVEHNPTQPVVMKVYCHTGWKLATQHSQLYCGPTLNLRGASQVMWMLQAGQPAGPMCRKAGKEYKPTASVDGTMVLNFSLSSSLTISQACQTLPVLMPEAIHSGLMAAGGVAGISIEMSAISAVSVGTCGRQLSPRRLMVGSRRLPDSAQFSSITTYQVAMADSSQALGLSAALRAPSQIHALEAAVTAHFKANANDIEVQGAASQQFQVQIVQDEVSVATLPPVLTTEPPAIVPAPFLRVNTRAPRSDEATSDDGGGAGIVAGAIVLSILGAALVVLVFLTYRQKMAVKADD
mmetsp:Transcript_70902/g.112056  ORF Transcript_70902/g.112056 Transcript_70902/m.112056 type:complete len:827 (-) Transcript_70902:6-2486(-)